MTTDRIKASVSAAVLAAVLFVSAGPVYADYYAGTGQDTFADKSGSGTCRHELYASCAPAGSLMSLFTVLTDALAFSISVPFSGGKTVEDRGSFGPLCLGYNWYFNDTLFLGASGSYEQLKNRWVYRDGTVDNTWQILSLMGKIGVQYGSDSIKLYHALHAGLGCIRNDFRFSTGKKDSDSTFAPGFHFSLIGIKIGQKQGFNVFADAGIGYLGFVNFGASYSF